MPMRIVTWNVNGIRSLKPDLGTVIGNLNADLLCFQETKINKEQLDSRLCFIQGYSSYFSWCKTRGGYSGVSVYVRDATVRAIACCDGLTGYFESANGKSSSSNATEFGELDLDLSPAERKELDEEGRCLMLKFRISATENLPTPAESTTNGNGHGGSTFPSEFVLINVYAPRVDGAKPERLTFKMRFFELLKRRIGACLQSGYAVLLVGDLNLTHSDLDVREGCEGRERCNDDTRMSRDWLSGLLDDLKLVDLYRRAWPSEREKGYTNWCQLTNARSTNFGARIDYEIASANIAERLISCDALQNVVGSDHCPVMSVVGFVCEKRKTGDNSSIQSICATRSMPEFSGGAQKSILGYFSRPKVTDVKPPEAEAQTDPGVPMGDQNASQSQRLQATELKGVGDAEEQPSAKKRKITQFFSKTAKPKDEVVAIDEVDSDSNTTSAQCDIEQQKQAERSSQQAQHVNSCEVDAAPKSSTAESDDCKKTEACEEMEERGSNEDVPRKGDAFAVLLAERRPPLCKGHNEACVLRVVKAGTSANRGRAFWCCARPEGAPSNPAGRCNFFVWADTSD